MTFAFEQGKEEIIDQVVAKINVKLKGNNASLCAKFAQRFYSTVSLDDLERHSIDDLYGAVVSYWSFAKTRKSGDTKIHIYNPDFEKHGWQSTHTIVEILQNDTPFLVDSVLMEVNRLGFTSHLIIHVGHLKVKRNARNQIVDIIDDNKQTDDCVQEAPILIEIDRQTDPAILENLHQNLERVITDVQYTVHDWQAMRKKLREAVDKLNKVKQHLDADELAESKDFLHWIEDHHFTFLGIRDYELISEEGEVLLKPIEKSGLGVLRNRGVDHQTRNIADLTPEAQRLALSNQILIISKTNTQSTVHRPVYTDYIGIKLFDNKGQVIGERRIIGLYTSAAYNTNPKHIPFLRRKVAQVMNKSKLNVKGHAWKVLMNILETLPRDDLFQATSDELLETSIGIFQIQERRMIRFFARKDIYGRFISCLAYVPRERFNTQLREQMQKILAEVFNAIEISFATRFSDSVLARIHFVVRINSDTPVEYNVKDIEKKLADVARSWTDDLRDILVDQHGEEEGNLLFTRYGKAFAAGYTADYVPRSAVYDIKHIERLNETHLLEMNFYQPVDASNGSIRFKVYHYNSTVPLSDVLPILENMGLRVIGERPYELKFGDNSTVWINDFGMEYMHVALMDIDEVRDIFQQSFANTWNQNAENDGFNRLVLSARLNWREISVLRAYAKFFRQIGLTFSQDYIEDALTNNAYIASGLIQLFHARLDPAVDRSKNDESKGIHEQLLKAMDSVASLDEDRILRLYLSVIKATLRTNYYQRQEDGSYKTSVSFKFESARIPNMPLPIPKYEIFVYSPRVEGVHLRTSKVARGGLRLSDRPQDFRTEILGLVKAQNVKNAVIVPSGAKGGFVPRSLPMDGTREEIMAESIKCYKIFIRGLLDLTDNLVAGKIVPPKDVVRYDDDDHYFVVAADKGTATFSDIANSIANEYNFWLDDAFASGGSTGYDHKKMGITARGAWESIKRHFRELGTDCQSKEFSCIGVGDMAGDVFGNGMLLSKHTEVVGAFNHMHIFLDPNPDIDASFKERQRLFNLSRSTWEDYDEKLISKGGGIYSRKAKSIKLTTEVKQLLGLKQDFIEPNDLMRAMLLAPVDLLWNGGIGTFIKGTNERNAEVGDRANDAIRVNANQLRCKMIGEGGNLGVTQLGRVEYALNGGMLYTDFIDNSAGVDCSDHEVNIKILLNTVVSNGDMTEKQRNKLLAEMTDEVAELVLINNYKQTRAISVAAIQAPRNIELHIRYINDLEQRGQLQRDLEFLPDDKALQERKLSGIGLTKPGISVLLAYSKIQVKQAILQSDVPEDDSLDEFLFEAFPTPLRKKYAKELKKHSLRRELVATVLSNAMINEMGFAFVYRMADETGAPVAAIVRAFAAVRKIFQLEELWNAIDSLDNQIPAQQQYNLIIPIVRLIRRATRWFLRNNRMQLDIGTTIERFAEGIAQVKQHIPGVLGKTERQQSKRMIKELIAYGVPEDIADKMAQIRALFAALDIVDVAQNEGADIKNVAYLFFHIGEVLELNWIRSQVIAHPTDNHWEALSREALRDDLDIQQRMLTVSVLQFAKGSKPLKQTIKDWLECYFELVERWQHMLAELRSSTSMNITMFFVAIRELMDLTQTSLHVSIEQVKEVPKKILKKSSE